jgi:taurine--2-oxoglutarate transaminase
VTGGIILAVFFSVIMGSMGMGQIAPPMTSFFEAKASAKPMLDIAAACKKEGLWPFAHFNRMHIVPPCTVSADEIREGMAIIDQALDIADSYYKN